MNHEFITKCTKDTMAAMQGSRAGLGNWFNLLPTELASDAQSMVHRLRVLSCFISLKMGAILVVTTRGFIPVKQSAVPPTKLIVFLFTFNSLPFYVLMSIRLNCP